MLQLNFLSQKRDQILEKELIRLLFQRMAIIHRQIAQNQMFQNKKTRIIDN